MFSATWINPRYHNSMGFMEPDTINGIVVGFVHNGSETLAVLKTDGGSLLEAPIRQLRFKDWRD